MFWGPLPIEVEEGWTFIRMGVSSRNGGEYYCECPVIKKIFGLNTPLTGQFLHSQSPYCSKHGLKECRGCGEWVWAGSHYVSGTNPFEGTSDFESYYRCQTPRMRESGDPRGPGKRMLLSDKANIHR